LCRRRDVKYQQTYIHTYIHTCPVCRLRRRRRVFVRLSRRPRFIYINTISDWNRLVKWAKVLPNFDPIWRSIGPRGQKLWVKIIFVILHFCKMFELEVGVVDPPGNVRLDLPDLPLEYGPLRQAVSKLLNVQ